MTSISVVIPAYNHLPEVLTCLNSLQAFASRQVDIEFIVSDDCSPDYNLQALIPPFSAKVVRNEQNLGFAGNCNAGAEHANGDVILFCNQDVFAVGQDIDGKPFSQQWDIALAAAFDNPQVGVVGAKLVFPDNKIQSAGGLFDAHCQPYHRCLGYSNHRYHEVNTPQVVSWVTGAALAIRCSLFTELGGFDTGYVRGYFEDADLCMKAQVAGYKVWYEPRCQLVHSVGSTGGSPYFMQNARRFYDMWVATKKVEPDTTALKERWW